jgi:hypothetical protein
MEEDIVRQGLFKSFLYRCPNTSPPQFVGIIHKLDVTWDHGLFVLY